MPAQRPPLLLVLGFAAFLAVIPFIVAASLVQPTVAEFAPTPPGARPRGGPGPDTVTIDAGDERHWRFYSFRRGVLSPPDTTDWDLGFRRHHIIASGAVADAGVATLDTVAGGLASVFMKTEFARDTITPTLARWYRYSFVTHLLRPNGHVFLVRTREGALVKMEILGYYCPGTRPGCPSFRWAWLKP